ncbi:pyridoxal-phosphate dependent enzyme [Nonomuraea dietziae]|uniref:pyridoxal-phosphate dependent enzyme n=1 Tax=Nonomuraea dietziae TaxID=65515 RepID=UPI00343FBEFA
MVVDDPGRRQPEAEGSGRVARLDRVAELLTREPNAYCPEQYDNPDNVDAYAGLGRELVEQLAIVDVLVCSVGTGGHSAGTFEQPGQRYLGWLFVRSNICAILPFSDAWRRHTTGCVIRT